MTHSLDILICKAAIGHELHSRLLTAVHHLIAGEALALAVDWPDWRSQNGEFGLMFRVFGTLGELALYRDTVRKLGEAGLVSIQSIIRTPESDEWVMCSRDESGNRRNQARMRRLQRRALARGEASPKYAEKTSRFRHYLPMQSTSRGTIFPLGIQRQPCPPDTPTQPKGNGYGLGIAVPAFIR